MNSPIEDRPKTNLKSFSDSVLETSEGLKRSLYNFKTDLLSLKQNSRYSGKQI